MYEFTFYFSNAGIANVTKAARTFENHTKGVLAITTYQKSLLQFEMFT